MKGVFCIEGFWYGDHRDHTSVYPVLDLVHRYQKLPFIHHRAGTFEEFCFSISRWKQKGFHKNYPLLYLAFHGDEGVIIIGKKRLTIEELADLLEDKCSGVVIYFGSCSTLKIRKNRIQSFMEKTGTVAILGYKLEVDWLTSASFEIRLLSHLLEHPFDSQGVTKIKAEIEKACKSYTKELDFKMEVNERVWFARKRKKV